MTVPTRRSFVMCASDDGGVTAVEFALLAPVFLLLLMGTFVLGQQVYATALLQGALQDAARASTIESGHARYVEIDARLREAVLPIIPGAEIELRRRNFASFAHIVQPEQFTDTNGNGKCDAGEPFEDLNGNAIWDRDRGRDGLGGARDAVVLIATATYERLLPMPGEGGLGRTVTLEGKTVLRNQPFNEQGVREAELWHCT